jgi:hypothetical protein
MDPILDELETAGACPVCGSPAFSCRTDALSSEGGVRIIRLGDQEGTMHTLTAKTWVNANSTAVVPEGSPEAAWLLGLEGDEISDETAERLGLNAAPKKSKSKSKATADETADEAGVTTAQVETPEEA